MNILWVTNIPFPEPSIKLGLKPPVTGGWMYSLAEALRKLNTIKLTILSFYDNKDNIDIEVDNIRYIMLSKNILDNSQIYSKCLEINDSCKPDVIHVHGTEFNYGMYFLKSCPQVGSIVSIQGLVGVYSRYYTFGLTMKDILVSAKKLNE